MRNFKECLTVNEGTTNEHDMERWDKTVEALGAEEVCEALIRWMSADDIKSFLDYINRVYELHIK